MRRLRPASWQAVRPNRRLPKQKAAMAPQQHDGHGGIPPPLMSERSSSFASIRWYRRVLTLRLGYRIIQVGVAIFVIVKVVCRNSRDAILSHCFSGVVPNGRACFSVVSRCHLSLSYLGLRDGGNGSELLAVHPGINVLFRLFLGDPLARFEPLSRAAPRSWSSRDRSSSAVAILGAIREPAAGRTRLGKPPEIQSRETCSCLTFCRATSIERWRLRLWSARPSRPRAFRAWQAPRRTARPPRGHRYALCSQWGCWPAR